MRRTVEVGRTVKEGRLVRTKRDVGISEDPTDLSFHSVSEGPWTIEIAPGISVWEKNLVVNMNASTSTQRYSTPLVGLTRISISDFMELGMEILDMLAVGRTDHISMDATLLIRGILNRWLIRKDLR